MYSKLMNKQRAIRHVNRHYERKIRYELLAGVAFGFFMGPMLVVLVIVVLGNAEAIDSAVNEFISWVVLKLSL